MYSLAFQGWVLCLPVNASCLSGSSSHLKKENQIKQRVHCQSELHKCTHLAHSSNWASRFVLLKRKLASLASNSPKVGKLIQKTPSHNEIWQQQWVVWHHPITANIDTAQGESGHQAKLGSYTVITSRERKCVRMLQKLESLMTTNTPINAQEHYSTVFQNKCSQYFPDSELLLWTKPPRKPDIGFLITSSQSPPQPTYKLTSFVKECRPGGGFLSHSLALFFPFLSLVDSRKP